MILELNDFRSPYVSKYLEQLVAANNPDPKPEQYNAYFQIADDYYDTLLNTYNVNPLYVPGDKLDLGAAATNVEVGTLIQDTAQTKRGSVIQISGNFIYVNMSVGEFEALDVLETVADNLAVGTVVTFTARTISSNIKAILQLRASIDVAFDNIQVSVKKINQDVTDDPWETRYKIWDERLQSLLEELTSDDFYDPTNPPPDEEDTTSSPNVSTWRRA